MANTPQTISYDQLLEAGVHFGHLSRKWHPAMAPYIFMERNNIHIIDLLKTQRMLDEACRAAEQLAKSGRKILFVGTKKQAQEILEGMAREVNMPYVTNRWLGGMLTNFATVRKSVRKLQNLEKMETDGTAQLVNKKERLMLGREKLKLDAVLGGISDMSRLPSALFIVDVKKEHIAVAEARKLGIPTIGIVDTNSDPNAVDFPIPGNDDAAKSIEVISRYIVEAIKRGLQDRKDEREETQKATEEVHTETPAAVAETVEE
ncbi:MAG: 30S ribosomal protein S2 [Bacteroidia bacterium]|nr:30S ribosomal protein S2 [Bacteroidia bacterium]